MATIVSLFSPVQGSTNAFRVENGPQAIGTMSTIVVGHIIARRVIFYLHPQCALEEEFKNVAKEDKSGTTDQSLRSALLSCSCDFLMSYKQKMVCGAFCFIS